MKNLILVLLSIILSGCGVKSQDERSTLTESQRADIANRLGPHGVVNLSAEPENFNGPRSAYVVNGEAVQVVSVAELPGKAKYAACAACHGARGGGGIGPMLSGQSAEYISGRLLAYKAGETVGAQSALMWGQSSMLSESDIQDIAEYVESL